MNGNLFSRRRFLRETAVAGSIGLLPSAQGKTGRAATPAYPVLGPREGQRSGTAVPFPLGQVRLLPSQWKEMTERNSAFLHSLPNDRLLYNFNISAGRPSSAKPLGGWEAPDCDLRGHFVGHYLSACALLYGSTGDTAIRQKANELVAGLAECQNKNGYLGAYGDAVYDRLRDFKRVWAPFYTYHKLLAGMIDMYELAGNEQALAVARRMADWADAWSAKVPTETFQRILLEEHGGISESLYNLYGITKEPRYQAAALRFEHRYFLDPLTRNEDRLAGNHANTNIPKVIGAARAYELTGREQYRDISENFYRMVVQHHSYCTGGTSDEEYWFEPDAIASRLGPKAQECCCSYNMLKLTRHLYTWNADPAYFDYYERVLLNQRDGTQNDQGMLMYYVAMTPGLYRTFGSHDNSFWCCTGSGTEEFAKLTNSIYFHDETGVYVNLFIPATLDWKERGLKLEQTTEFPRRDVVRLTVREAPADDLPIHVRIPHYVQGSTVRLNGHRQPAQADAGTYLTVSRRWKPGDVLEVTLPMTVRIERAPDNPQVQAAMYGPLALAVLMGDDLLEPSMFHGPQGPDVQGRAHPLPRIDGSDVWAERVVAGGDAPLRFRTVGSPAQYTLLPFSEVREQRYSIYVRNVRQA